MVGRGGDLAEDLLRDGAPNGEVRVRGEPALGLDRSEVLDVPPFGAAKVLPEPVEQGREMHGVPGRAAVVVCVRVNRCAVVADLAVAGQGEGQERGVPVDLALVAGVDTAGGAGVDRAVGQGGAVLAPAGGPRALGLPSRRSPPGATESFPIP